MRAWHEIDSLVKYFVTPKLYFHQKMCKYNMLLCCLLKLWKAIEKLLKRD